MTPNEIQLKIDNIIDRSFQPSREQKITGILTIISSLEFETVLNHSLKATFNCDDITDLTDEDLEKLFQIARTWRYQADAKPAEPERAVVVNFPNNKG